MCRWCTPRGAWPRQPGAAFERRQDAVGIGWLHEVLILSQHIPAYCMFLCWLKGYLALVITFFPTLRVTYSMEPEEGAPVQRLLAAWKRCDAMVSMGSAGVMARVKAKDAIERRDVCTNIDSILPVVMHLGYSFANSPCRIHTIPEPA